MIVLKMKEKKRELRYFCTNVAIPLVHKENGIKNIYFFTFVERVEQFCLEDLHCACRFVYTINI